MDGIKRTVNFFIRHYNSLLLAFGSFGLGLRLMYESVPHYGSALVFFSALKLYGLISNKPKIRVVGLIGINSFWAIAVYLFASKQIPPHEVSYQIPLFVLLFGLGISLRGRFDER